MLDAIEQAEREPGRWIVLSEIGHALRATRDGRGGILFEMRLPGTWRGKPWIVPYGVHRASKESYEDFWKTALAGERRGRR